MKKMTKAMLMTALILGSVQWGGTPVHANELDTFALDEYVVTATRTPVELFNANANISVVTKEQIEKVLLGEGAVEDKVIKLIKKANNRGGTDNISVAYLVREEGEDK